MGVSSGVRAGADSGRGTQQIAEILYAMKTQTYMLLPVGWSHAECGLSAQWATAEHSGAAAAVRAG